MLLSNDEFNLEDLDYTNMFESIKRDGVRAEVINGELVGRSLKRFRNEKLHKYFSGLNFKYIIEGEIYCHGIPCREMAGICNSSDKEIPEGTKLYVFGMYDSELNFDDRQHKIATYIENLSKLKYKKIELVRQNTVRSPEEVKRLFNYNIKNGYEGSVLMDGSKKYKEGRVTINEHIGFKLKPHREDDLLIIGVTERFLNTNESQTNELGHSYKRNTVDAKKSTGIAATFICKMDSGEETKVTITGEESFRKEIWDNQEQYIGQYAVVKSMDYGVKTKLRHPRLLSIKPKQ